MSREKEELVSVRVENSIGVITLNNPPLNVLSSPLIEQLHNAIETIASSEDVRAIVLKASGDKAFAAGADIHEFPQLTRESGVALVERGKVVFDRLANLDAPVICSIQGLALGAGLELALACDIRIAEKTARLGLPETGLGILPGYGGTQRLTRLVGPGKAKEIVLAGVLLSAEEAKECGLVERVVETGEAGSDGMKLAQQIASKGPKAVANAKKAIDQGIETTLAEAQKIETDLFAELVGTADMAEGVAAFMEKRPSRFIGK